MLRAKCWGIFISRMTSVPESAPQKNDFDAAIHRTRLLQQWRERRTTPLCGADTAREPREAMIAAAFDRVHDLLLEPGLDRGKRQRHRLLHQPGDLEIPFLFVDDGLVVVRHTKELVVGRNESRSEVFPRLQVLDHATAWVCYRLVQPLHDFLARSARKRLHEPGRMQ
jgi:hypothetical protein